MINQARYDELLDKAKKRYNLHDHWLEDHWPNTAWPEECLKAEIAFGHPGYRFLPLAWTDVMVTLKTKATRKGKIAQVTGKWIYCIVQLEPSIKPGCYPFRCDKVQPWDRNPVPYSGQRKQSALEVIGKEESHEPKKKKEKAKTKKQIAQDIINRNNFLP